MKIIFLTYVNRSGSTFLANTLSKSKDIIAFPEAEILVNLLLVQPELKFDSYKEIYYHLLKDPKLKSWGLKREDLPQLEYAETNFDAFIYLLNVYKNKYKPDAKVLLFKAERLIYLYNRIYETFQNCINMLLVTIIRDPRAIFKSQKISRNLYGSSFMNTNPVFLAIFWTRFMSLLDTIQLRKDVFIIKYEELIQRFDESCKLLEEIIGINKIDQSVRGDLMKRIPIEQHSIHKLIEQKPQLERISKWEDDLKDQEIYLIEKYSHIMMNRFNYQTKYSRKEKIFNMELIGISSWIRYYLRKILNKIIFRIIKLFVK